MLNSFWMHIFRTGTNWAKNAGLVAARWGPHYRTELPICRLLHFWAAALKVVVVSEDDVSVLLTNWNVRDLGCGCSWWWNGLVFRNLSSMQVFFLLADLTSMINSAPALQHMIKTNIKRYCICRSAFLRKIWTEATIFRKYTRRTFTANSILQNSNSILEESGNEKHTYEPMASDSKALQHVGWAKRPWFFKMPPAILKT